MLLETLPADRSGRWATLDAIIGRWFNVQKMSGISGSDLDAAEARLHVKLPASFREWYSRYALLHQVWSVQDRLLPADQFDIYKGILRFGIENQSVVYWGVELTEPADDPPVLLYDRNLERWDYESESFSLFAIQFALINAKFSCHPSFHANGKQSGNVLAKIQENYAQLAVPGTTWPGNSTWYGNDHLIIEANGDNWLWVTALTEEAFDHADHIVKTTGMTWEHIERDSFL